MLDAWSASPARFREDANAEDDLALGGYRDRLLVELAANASDAAGTGGSLRLAYDGGTLRAANTGAPLDAAGVAALATLRASAKRGSGTVGRFGVGFAAVAAVADEVVVASTTGAVRFSRADTARALADLPALQEELHRRGGRVPLLRLAFPSDVPPLDGWTTEVRVRVRPDADPLVRDLLGALDATLLLVLPGLRRLEVDGRVLTAQPEGDDVLLDGARWRQVRGEGELAPALLASRPVEERERARWAVGWAAPVSDAGVPLPLPVPPLVRAPTPTDDPLSLPALLVATLPLGPDRRRVQPGPVTDAVLAAAADLLADLVLRLADGPERLAYVPGPLGAGEVDAQLGGHVLARLRRTAFLAGRRPEQARVLDGASDALVALLADVVDLLPAPWSATRWAAPLRALGVRRLDLAGLTEVLAGRDAPSAWWRALYDALPPDRDALGALPVPLSDGRLAGSPRGLLLAELPVDLAPLGLRVVHPQAASPLLLRLGATPAEPRALLDDPRVRAAVEAALDEDDPAPVADAVLGLVAGAGVRPGELPWLAALPLPDVAGEWRPAGELLLPGGPLAAVVDPDAGFGTVRADVAPPDVLVAVGVLRGFAVVPVDEAHGVDGLDEWLADLPPGEEPGLVVRDLDLVRDDAWPQALALLRADGLLALPYARWWVARHPVLDGRRPVDLCAPGADPLLAGLYDEAADDVGTADVPGLRRTLAEVLADDPAGLLDRLADPGRPLGRAQVRAVHAALAAADPDVDPPDRVRAVVDGALRVVPADDAVVVDRPDLLARAGPYAVVPCPLDRAAALADLLDLALASEVVPAPALGGTGVVEHDRLRLPDAGGGDIDVVWAMDGAADHVVGVAGRARATAWRAGVWETRHAVAARLSGAADPAEDDLDPV